MKKTVWTYGLISGGILSALMLLTIPFVKYLGMEASMLVGYTTMVLAFLMVFFGVRSYRDHVGDGTVGFWRALAVGSLIMLVASICYVATWQVLYFGVPGFAEQFQLHMLDQVRGSGESPEAIRARLAELRHFFEIYQNPLVNFAMTLLEPLPVGLVFALVSAGILSRGRRGERAGLVSAAA